MRKVSMLVALSLAFAVTFAQDQRNYTRADFINVEGSNLNDKIDRVMQRAVGDEAKGLAVVPEHPGHPERPDRGLDRPDRRLELPLLDGDRG